MAKKTPNYTVYSVIGDGQNANWHSLGAAWLNQDESISIRLNALPLGDKLVLRAYVPKEDRE